MLDPFMSFTCDPTRQPGVRLSVHGLWKSYDGVAVLKGIDFEVHPGEIFVIIGPSGSGKSVLLKQLIGLEAPDRGNVMIDGEPIQPPDSPTSYRVAMVFQSCALLASMTVGENVGIYLTAHRLKPPGEIAEIVARDLEQVGLKGAENKMPYELSDGMRKRVAIARALVVEPQLMFYDKPTSALDPVSAAGIAENIVRINGLTHATTVVVSHDRELAFQIAHRIAMLDEGRIVAIGTPDEIRCNPDPRVHQFLAACIIPRVAVCDRLPSVDAKLVASIESSS
jgi:phospholipid/cholesterol/gamma-HCH transport system ATP-binding protein